MKDVLTQQYQAIRDTIKINVQTVGRLIAQAENLKSVVAGISDQTIKGTLEKDIEQIEATITTLIHQTDELFDQYQKFVEEVFSKK